MYGSHPPLHPSRTFPLPRSSASDVRPSVYGLTGGAWACSSVPLPSCTDAGGVPIMLSDSSFWWEEHGGALGCFTYRRESCLGGAGLILTGGSTRTQRCHRAIVLPRRQGWVPVATFMCV